LLALADRRGGDDGASSPAMCRWWRRSPRCASWFAWSNSTTRAPRPSPWSCWSTGSRLSWRTPSVVRSRHRPRFWFARIGHPVRPSARSGAGMPH